MNRLQALVHGVGLIGGPNAVRSVRFALRRAVADRSQVPLQSGTRRATGMASGIRSDGAKVEVDFERAMLELRFPRPGQVSVGWMGALTEPSYAVIDPGACLVPQVEAVDGGWVVRGPAVTVEIGMDGSLAFCDEAGAVRLRQTAPVWDGVGWTQSSAFAAGAGVHGLGGRSVWDLRGGTYRCWNTDPGGAWLPGRDPLYVTTPVYLVLDDAGAVQCFVDNPCDGTFDVVDGALTARFVAGPARWHVTLGTLPQVLNGYTALTGRPALPPRWALGHHQARWGYGSAAAVREVWQRFRENGLPLSAMHLDIDSMEKYRNFTFNENFKEVERLVADMAADDVRTVVIVDAGIARDTDYSVYRDGLERDVFCRSGAGEVFEGVVWPGPTVFPDFTDAAARDWWGEQFRAFTDRGVAGYWHDMNEPACFAPFGDPTFPLSTRHALDGRPADHRYAHNIYALQMCRASHEGLRRLQPQQRPFLFSRSGWAGMQRYGGHWSGDIEADWSSLLGTIHQGLAYGASGVGYYGSDIGGFTGQPSPELFARWFQLASFLPFFRTHCAFQMPRREPWEWGEEVMGVLREALVRRYRLLPYWYTLAHAAARDGAPYVRPMAWADAGLRAVDDQFLLGDDVVVAPVLCEGAATRTVVLPAGAWFHGETGQRYEGRFDFAVGPHDVPWFVRAGAVVPTQESSDLVLLVTPPEGSEAPGGRLVTDAGDGWDPPHEERYDVVRSGDEILVTRSVVAGGHLPFTSTAVRRVDAGPVRLVG